MPVKRRQCAALDNARSIFHHHGMDIETRMSAVKADLASVKADLALIRSNYVTKADRQAVRLELKVEIEELRLEIAKLRVEMQAMRAEFHKELNRQTWRLYGFAVVLVGAVHLLSRYGY